MPPWYDTNYEIFTVDMLEEDEVSWERAYTVGIVK